MRKFSLKDTVELIGIAAIVASLVFVGLQIRQDQEIAIVDTYGDLSQSSIDLAFKIGEKMEIWKKGLNGDQLTEDEHGIFLAQATSVHAYFLRMWIRWDRLGPFDPSLAASRYAYALYVFPGLRQEYELADRFESSLNSARGHNLNLNPFELAIDEYLEQFDQKNPLIPGDRRYMFWSF